MSRVLPDIKVKERGVHESARNDVRETDMPVRSKYRD